LDGEDEPLSSTNLDQIYFVLDLFKHAQIESRGKDIANEATCLARIGKLWAKILKNKDMGYRSYKDCAQLARTLHPIDFTVFEWYIEAMDYLQKSDNELYHNLSKEQRTKLLEELKDELDKIKAEKDRGALFLLDFLYKNHPPKLAVSFVFVPPPPTVEDGLKKALLKAITHYHPDRQNNATIKERVKYQEITKFITEKYQMFK